MATAKGGDILEHVTCSICMEVYRDPRMLPCGHSFCTECIAQYAKSKGNVECPECRHTVNITPVEIDKLQKNFQLAAISSKLTNEANISTQSPMCVVHKQTLSVFCSRCEQVICVDCLNSEHEGHTIGNINKEYEKVKSLLRRKIEHVDVTIKELQSTMETQVELIGVVNKSEVDQLRAVDTAIRDLQAILDRKKTELKTSMRQKRQPQINSRKKQLELCGDLCFKLQKQLEECRHHLSKPKVHMLKDYKYTVSSIDTALKEVAAKDLSRQQILLKPEDYTCSGVEEAKKQLHQISICLDHTVDKETVFKTWATDKSERLKVTGQSALSEMAGGKLRENNTNISDLSDPNRPTKLAERFAGLYDDEWSDAYEELTKSRLYPDEASVIAQLLDVVWMAQSLCADVMARQRAAFTKAFNDTMVYPNQLKGNTDKVAFEVDMSRQGTTVIEEALRKSETHLVQAQRAASEASVPILKMMFIKRVKSEKFPREHDRVASSFCAYAEKCIELTWLMAAQDPPMQLQECEVGKLTPTHFLEYTGRGSIVQAVVWPALFLCEDGPLMAKGVVFVK